MSNQQFEQYSPAWQWMIERLLENGYDVQDDSIKGAVQRLRIIKGDDWLVHIAIWPWGDISVHRLPDVIRHTTQEATAIELAMEMLGLDKDGDHA